MNKNKKYLYELAIDKICFIVVVLLRLIIIIIIITSGLKQQVNEILMKYGKEVNTKKINRIKKKK